MSPKKKANTERISTFLPPEALSKLKDEANEKGINVSALIRMIVLEHLAQKNNGIALPTTVERNRYCRQEVSRHKYHTITGYFCQIEATYFDFDGGIFMPKFKEKRL